MEIAIQQAPVVQRVDNTFHWINPCPLDCTVDHFTVACLVACPLNESEAGGGLVLIESSMLFLC